MSSLLRIFVCWLYISIPEPPREDKLENILRKTMPGLVFLLIFVMIAYMLVFVCQKLTVRRVIPSIDVEIKEDDSRGKVDNELEWTHVHITCWFHIRRSFFVKHLFLFLDAKTFLITRVILHKLLRIRKISDSIHLKTANFNSLVSFKVFNP